MSVPLLVLGTAVAGACGAVVRDVALRHAGPTGGPGRARAVAAVNLLGTALLATRQVLPVAGDVRFLLGVGFCGSLTTFSTWVVEALARVDAGTPWHRVAWLDLGAQVATGMLVVVTVLRHG